MVKISKQTVTLHTNSVRFPKTLQHPLNEYFGGLQCLKNERYAFAAGRRVSLDEDLYLSEDFLNLKS